MSFLDDLARGTAGTLSQGAQIGASATMQRQAQRGREQQFQEQAALKKLLSARKPKKAGRLAKAPKESQFKAGGFATRAEQAEQALANVQQAGFDPTSTEAAAYQLIPSLGGVGDLLKGQTEGGRQAAAFDQAKNNFISAILRRESGAAISDEEYEREDKKYFPQPGDGARVLAQKAKARQQAVSNLKTEAGPAYRMIQEAPQMPVSAGPSSMPASVPTPQPAPEDPRARLQFLRQKYGR